MTRTEYFFVFETIIYGLALTELLTGLNRMIEARKTIKVYWAHLVFVFLYIFIMLTRYCWQFYRNPFELVDSGFTFFIFVAIYPITFFFGAYQGFPKVMEHADFKVFFLSKRKEILIPVLVTQVAAVIKTSADVVSVHSTSYFLNHIASGASIFDFWLQVIFVPLIAFATFSKKVWPAEMLAVLGVLGQLSIQFIQFRSV